MSKPTKQQHLQKRSLIAIADQLFHYAKETLVARSWSPIVQLAKNTLLNLMTKIDEGHLRVLCQDNIYEFGIRGAPDSVDIKIISDSFWVRLLLLGDLGFAEAYMLGDVVCDDLVTLMKIFVDNRGKLDDLNTISSTIFHTINYVTNTQLFANTVSNAINNIAAHYDISNDMFASFLSSDMTYSSAFFTNDHETLERAQMNKLRMIIEKARIGKNDHVLEIGSGWGSFAIEAVRLTNCRVTTLTLSVEQKALADARISEAGFESQITVLLCDYRNLPASHQFDKIVSIEMIEAVGPEYLDTYFACCDRLLKEKGGIAVFQVITMPETRYEKYCKEVDFIRKYIFPGGHCPTVTTLTTAIHRGSKGRLIIDDLQNIGPHYARTLRLWREQFLAVFDHQIRPALLGDTAMSHADTEVFRKKWEYYFAYCEAGFRERILGNVQVVVAREGGGDMLVGVPL